MNALHLLISFSSYDDLQHMRTAAAHIDRIIQLRLARDSSGTAEAWIEAGPIDAERLDNTEANASAVISILARYRSQNMYRAEVLHVLARYLMFGSMRPYNIDAAILTLWFLVGANEPYLLEQHLRFIGAQYTPPAEHEAAAAPKTEHAELLNIFSTNVADFPHYRLMQKAMPWAHNVAACLVHHGMQSNAHACVAVLFQQPAFQNALPVAAFEALLRSSAAALLEIRAKQNLMPSIANAFIGSDEEAKTLADFARTRLTRPFESMLSLMAEIVRRTDIVDHYEKLQPQSGTAALAIEEPDVAVDRAAISLQLLGKTKAGVEACLMLLRNEVVRNCPVTEGYLPHFIAALSEPKTADGYVGDTFDPAVDILLAPSSKAAEPEAVVEIDPDDDIDDLLYTAPPPPPPQPEAEDPCWAVRGVAATIKHMLEENQVPATIFEDKQEIGPWVEVGVAQALYRYYSLVLLPQMTRARATLQEARRVADENRLRAHQMSREEVLAKIRTSNAASYFGEEE